MYVSSVGVADYFFLPRLIDILGLQRLLINSTVRTDTDYRWHLEMV